MLHSFGLLIKLSETAILIETPGHITTLQRGDVHAVREAMKVIGVPVWTQRGLIRNALNPAGELCDRMLLDFYQYATPEQRQSLENAR